MEGLGSKVHFKAPSPRKINDKLSSQFVSTKSLFACFVQFLCRWNAFLTQPVENFLLQLQKFITQKFRSSMEYSPFSLPWLISFMIVYAFCKMQDLSNTMIL